MQTVPSKKNKARISQKNVVRKISRFPLLAVLFLATAAVAGRSIPNSERQTQAQRLLEQKLDSSYDADLINMQITQDNFLAGPPPQEFVLKSQKANMLKEGSNYDQPLNQPKGRQLQIPDPCDTVGMSINLSFASPALTYIVNFPPQSLTWSDANASLSNPLLNCGPLEWELTDLFAGGGGYDNQLFTFDNVNPYEIVTESNKATAAATYSLRLTVTLANFALNPGTTYDFTVVVIQCENVSITPSGSQADIIYTVGRPMITTLKFSDFIVVPSECPLDYAVTISPPLPAADVGAIFYDKRQFQISTTNRAIADVTYTVLVAYKTPDGLDTGAIGLVFDVQIVDPCKVATLTMDPSIVENPLNYYAAFPANIQTFLDSQITVSETIVACPDIVFEVVRAIDNGMINNQVFTYDDGPQTFSTETDKSFNYGAYSLKLIASFDEVGLTQRTEIDFVVNVIDSCLANALIIPQVQTNPSYSYDGTKLTKTIAPFQVTPAGFCTETFSCTVTSGPRTDLCNLLDGISQGTFDPTDGTYEFISNEFVNVVPGTYTFVITLTIGSVSVQTTYDLILKNPCDDAIFTFKGSPFTSKQIDLGDPDFVQSWETDNLVNTNLNVDCGVYAVDFYLKDGLKTPLDATLFQDFRSTDLALAPNELTVLSSVNYDHVGIYDIVYYVYYKDFPSANIESAIFSIEIVLTCPSPISFTSSTLPLVEYTITDDVNSFIFDPFITDPGLCDVVYTYTISDSLGGTVITNFVDFARTFQFKYQTDLLPSGGPQVEFADYTITISAVAGFRTPQTVTGTFTFKVKNPCYDYNFVWIQSSPLPPFDLKYTLYDGLVDEPVAVVTHDPFKVVTQPIIHSFCGSLTHSASYMGDELTETSIPNAAYFPGNLTFYMYAEDLPEGDTLGELSAYLIDYPTQVIQTPIPLEIEIVAPCLNPVELKGTIQVNPLPYGYTGAFPLFDFYANPFYVNPPVCSFTYTCAMISGPRLDLCNFNNGSTIAIFNTALGYYTFRSSDHINFPPGDYVFEIKGLVGNLEATETWTMTLVEPCGSNFVFFMAQNPFADVVYTLADPMIELPWELGTIVEQFTLADCGSQTVVFKNADGSDLDTLIFEDFQDGISDRFKILQNSDIATVGVYELTYSVSFPGEPLNVKVQPLSFKVTIVDPCDEPVSLIAPNLEDQEYTITQDAFDYQAPVSTPNPSWCKVTYSFSVTNPAGTAAVSLDDTNLIFKFSQLDDVSLSGQTYQDYTVTYLALTGLVTPVEAQSTFKLRIKNPCVDQNYVTIQQVPLDDQTYRLTSQAPLGYQWRHAPFIVDSKPFPHSLCGEFTYIATSMGLFVDENSSPVSYDTTTQTFTIYSEDFTLIGVHFVMIGAYLTEYPQIATQTQAEVGLLTIDSPCPVPDDLVAGPQINPDSYGYTGQFQRAKFNMNPFIVQPTQCPVTYSCQVLSGPRTDMCSISELYTKSDFDTSTGDYEFQSIDKENYPPGTYIFEITGTVGNRSQSIQFELVLENPCQATKIFLNQMPFQDDSYVLRAPERTQNFKTSDLYYVNSEVNCGDISVEFFVDDASKSQIDPDIFRVDFDPATSNQFVVQQSLDITKKGTYNFRYKVYYALYDTNFEESQASFAITIIDPCDNPNDLLIPVLIEQEYTITQDTQSYTVPPFSSSPIWCTINYSYAVIDSAGEAAVTFDQTNLIFTFSQLSDLSLAGPDLSKEYTVTVKGWVGNVNQLQAESSFQLKLKNPCIDQSYVNLISSPLIDQQYIIYDFSLASPYTFTHDAYSIDTQPVISHSLCGQISYQAYFDGKRIDENSSPMSYNEATKTFSIFTEDIDLLGFHMFEIMGTMTNYPQLVPLYTREQAQIKMIDPCIKPFSLTLPVQKNPDPYLYTGAIPKLEFTPIQVAVTPPICPLQYSCAIIDGPRNGICSIIDGQTIGSFSESSGRFTFRSFDMVNYPAGVYTLEITATSGLTVDSFTVDLTLQDPCGTVDLGLQPSPFFDQVYILLDPPLDQVWQAVNLVDLQTKVDCGAIGVEFFQNTPGKEPIDTAIFDDDRSSAPLNKFKTKFLADPSLRGTYNFRYRVHLIDYPTNRIEQTKPFKIQVINSCADPIELLSQTLEDQTYTITQPQFTYTWPQFESDPDFCDILYSLELSDPDSALAFTADVDQSVRTFTFSNDQHLFLAGTSFKEYSVTVKAQLGTGSVIRKQSTFKLVIRNPCLDPKYISIQPQPLPQGMKYALWDYEPNLGFQFSHSPYQINYWPFQHTMCGSIEYFALFEGVQIGPASRPLAYDATSGSFDLYSEDESLKGLTTVVLIARLMDYTVVKSPKPDQFTVIEILDACLRPAQISIPQQSDPSSYLYTVQAAKLSVAPFIVDPPVCPVTYECISIEGPSVELTCTDPNVRIDSQTGELSFQTFDMVKYLPGDYNVTIRGTTGTVVPLPAEAKFNLKLVNPCFSAKFRNNDLQSLTDVRYVLGNQPIVQKFKKSDLVTLNTQVDCGSLEVEFLQENDKALPPVIFTVTPQDNSLTQEFIVNQQKQASTKGIYQVKYRVWLSDYPDVQIYQAQPFSVLIQEPASSSKYSFQVEPEWLKQLEDQTVYVEENLIYPFGAKTNFFETETFVKVKTRGSSRLVTYDRDINALKVRGEATEEEDVGSHRITVEVEFLDPTGNIQFFAKDFFLHIKSNIKNGGDDLDEDALQRQNDGKDYPAFDIDTFAGIIVNRTQSKEESRPIPYIFSLNPTGLLTIRWDRQMQSMSEPKVVESTKVAIRSDVFSSSLGETFNVTRSLKEGNQEMLVYVIKDALQLSLISESEDQSATIDAEINWSFVSYLDQTLQLQLQFESPERISASGFNEYLHVTFYGAELFKSGSGVAVKFGSLLTQRVIRQLSPEKAKVVESLEVGMNSLLISILFVVIIFAAIGGRLLPFWMFINISQLIVHTSMLGVNLMSSDLHMFLVKYLSILRLHSPSIDQEISQWQHETDMVNSDLLDKSTYSSEIASCGYHHSYSRNLVIIIFIATLILSCVLVLAILDKRCKRSGAKRVTPFMTNLGFRFTYEFFLEIVLTLMLYSTSTSLSQEPSTLNWLFHVLIWVGMVAFCTFLLSLFFVNGPYTSGTFGRNSLRHSWWGKRALDPKHGKAMTTKNSSDLNVQESERNLLDQAELAPIKIMSDDQKSLYEGGSSKEMDTLTSINQEAKIRAGLEQGVQPSKYFATLFDGLKLNTEHNSAILHPFMFTLRRVIYAIVIIHMTGSSVIFGALLLSLTSLCSLAFAIHERPWQSELIHVQHSVNESVFYFFTVALISFAGVLQSHEQAQTLGTVLIVLLCLLIIFNVAVIGVDAVRFAILWLKRYYRRLPRSVQRFIEKCKSWFNCKKQKLTKEQLNKIQKRQRRIRKKLLSSAAFDINAVGTEKQVVEAIRQALHLEKKVVEKMVSEESAEKSKEHSDSIVVSASDSCDRKKMTPNRIEKANEDRLTPKPLEMTFKKRLSSQRPEEELKKLGNQERKHSIFQKLEDPEKITGAIARITQHQSKNTRTPGGLAAGKIDLFSSVQLGNEKRQMTLIGKHRDSRNKPLFGEKGQDLLTEGEAHQPNFGTLVNLESINSQKNRSVLRASSSDLASSGASFSEYKKTNEDNFLSPDKNKVGSYLKNNGGLTVKIPLGDQSKVKRIGRGLTQTMPARRELDSQEPRATRDTILRQQYSSSNLFGSSLRVAAHQNHLSSSVPHTLTNSKNRRQNPESEQSEYDGLNQVMLAQTLDRDPSEMAQRDRDRIRFMKPCITRPISNDSMQSKSYGLSNQPVLNNQVTVSLQAKLRHSRETTDKLVQRSNTTKNRRERSQPTNFSSQVVLVHIQDGPAESDRLQIHRELSKGSNSRDMSLGSLQSNRSLQINGISVVHGNETTQQSAQVIIQKEQATTN